MVRSTTMDDPKDHVTELGTAALSRRRASLRAAEAAGIEPQSIDRPLPGEVIRGGSSRSPAGATASTVTPLAPPEPAVGIPTTGEAA